MQMSVEYKSNLDAEWWSAIANGTKTVEGRINEGKFAKMKKDDVIVFVNKDTKEEVCVVVKDTIVYGNFRDMIVSEGLDNVLPSRSSVDDGVDMYLGISDYRDREILGVVAIRIALA